MEETKRYYPQTKFVKLVATPEREYFQMAEQLDAKEIFKRLGKVLALGITPRKEELDKVYALTYRWFADKARDETPISQYHLFQELEKRSIKSTPQTSANILEALVLANRVIFIHPQTAVHELKRLDIITDDFISCPSKKDI